jgi:hypothetical protein
MLMPVCLIFWFSYMLAVGLRGWAHTQSLLAQCLSDAETVLGEHHALTISMLQLWRALLIRKEQFSQAEVGK